MNIDQSARPVTKCQAGPISPARQLNRPSLPNPSIWEPGAVFGNVSSATVVMDLVAVVDGRGIRRNRLSRQNSKPEHELLRYLGILKCDRGDV